MAKKPTHHDLPVRISVSRNVLGAATSFDAFELNIITIILNILRQFMYITDVLPEPGEFFLRFSAITNRHVVREELVERINKLRRKDIRYMITAPGVKVNVITGLFSSIVETNGGVYAKLSAEAIPWLLYIGKGVGYSQFEPELFIKMNSIYLKRLYCLLCAKVYKDINSFRITREHLYDVLGIPERTPVHDVQKRYLEGFRDYLEKTNSMYCFYFEPQFHCGSKAGRPTIDSFSILFNVKEERRNDYNFDSLNLLLKLIPILRKKHRVKNLADIHNELSYKNFSQPFIQAMSSYSQLTPEHQANILPKVLKDRFGIDVFLEPEKTEDDGNC